MKNIITSILLVFSFIISNGQNYNLTSLKFLPSNINPNELKPSDIPSEEVMRQMGMSDEEIAEALDFKYQRSIYSEIDTSSSQFNLKKFYERMGDELIKNDSISYPRGKVYGQDLFRTNEINFFQKSTDANPPNHYRISTGDQISISVWGNSEYSDIVTVDQKGYIDPIGFGRIYVKGLTFDQSRDLIKKKLGMSQSKMDITLSYSRVILVHIVGEVYNPGSYEIPAINTAFNALMAAKGPNQIGSVRNIYIKRNGIIVDSLDVYEFLFDPINKRDIFLEDGDYIVVTAAKDLVDVVGEVNRPYTYEVKPTDNIKDLIGYAGGFTTDASKNIISLKRQEDGVFLVHDVYKDDFSNTFLRSADKVIVNKINKRYTNYISLEGSVGVEGDYEYIEGENIYDFLIRSECINKYLFTESAYILRLKEDNTRVNIPVDLRKITIDQNNEENILLEEFDIVSVFSIDDFKSDFTVEVFGSVRNQGIISYGDGLRLRDILTMSGGVKNEASGSRIEISRVMAYNNNVFSNERSIVLVADISDELTLTDKDLNFLIEANDQIFVRRNPEYRDPINIIISGQVNFPGVYSLITDGDRVSDLIERSGGLTDNAFLEGVKLFRLQDIYNSGENMLDFSEEYKKAMLIDTSLYNVYSKRLLESERHGGENKEKIQVYNIVSFDLEKAIKSNSSKHNITLQEGDSLYVPKLTNVVYITGELFNFEQEGISTPFFEGKRANYYINNFAGGYSNQNDKSRTVVVYPNGSVKKSINFGFIKLSPKVKNGSTIRLVSSEKIKKKKNIPIDWNSAIENASVKVTGILSLYLLISRINGSF